MVRDSQGNLAVKEEHEGDLWSDALYPDCGARLHMSQESTGLSTCVHTHRERSKMKKLQINRFYYNRL